MLLGALVSSLACACARGGDSRQPAAAVAASTLPGGSGLPTPATSGWFYEIVASPRAEVLTVEAALSAGTVTELTVAEGAEPFVRDVVVIDGARRTPIAGVRGRWRAPSCAAGCRITYRFALGEAARGSGDRDVARQHGDAVESPPSAWLLRPLDAASDVRFRFHVTSAPSEAFATGVFPVAGATDTYEGSTGNGFDLPYAVFGRIRRMQAAGGHVEIAILPGAFRREQTILEWVERSAKAVDAFYGGFPIARVLVLVRPMPGGRVGFGTTMGGSGAAIAVPVGEDVAPLALLADWMLVHEMIHTALPDVTREHHWLEEGIATYAEPLARRRAGLVTASAMWREWILGMPQGQPESGDEGLDRTHTWGRTYWGGALFCLEADVAIRERTGGRKSLVDALRAIVRSGGNIAVSWPVDKVLDVGDAATGVPVLRETYARMGKQPGAVDLPRLWSKLGVRLERGVIIYDDAAPLASIRRAMEE